MKKLFIPGLLASILSGCGGSESAPMSNTKPASNTTTVSNTAPTLVGNLEQEVLALESNSFIFTLNDKESDKILVTMSNNPDWVINCFQGK